MRKTEKKWKYNGLDCEIIRIAHGEIALSSATTRSDFGMKSRWLCGYVSVPFADIEHVECLTDEGELDVNGGITFDETVGLIRTIGFDTNHGFNSVGDKMDTIEGVTADVERMADAVLSMTRKKG